MNSLTLFSMALGLQSPWQVTDISFSATDSARKELHLYIGCVHGSRFADETGAERPVHDTVDRVWRHLNFFEHHCFLHCSVPLILTIADEVVMADVPWSLSDSGFTPLIADATESLSRAAITFDRFHDVKLLNEAMENGRIVERLERAEYKYTFLRNQVNFSETKDKLLDIWGGINSKVQFAFGSSVVACIFILISVANASTSEIQAVYSADTQNNVTTNKPVVPKEVASLPANNVAGNGTTAVTGYNNTLNSNLFGAPETDITIGLTIKFGNGSVILSNGNVMAVNSSDMSWNGGYSTTESFNVSPTFAAGNHTGAPYSPEVCCSVGHLVPFSNNTTPFITYTISNNLASGVLLAVPEPETYGMMLSGLVLLAFMAHRKKSVRLSDVRRAP